MLYGYASQAAKRVNSAFPGVGCSPPRTVLQRRRRTGTARGWMTLSILTGITLAAPSLAADPFAPEPMTLDQVVEAGAGGTGCSWSKTGDHRMRFAAADDRAVIRLAGRIVVLAPAPHARELFPFTFTDWQAKGLSARLTQIGPARRLGSEATNARATLTITVGGTSRRLAGTMSCGS